MKRHEARTIAFAVWAALGMGADAALAAATPQELELLGTTHTAWGAEKAGNKEGTIPAYTGKITPPPNFDPKNPAVRPDPFAAEKPLYSIDAASVPKYADQLSDGLKEIFRKYPTFRMDVYPSHRTATYPKYVQDNSLKNARGACKAVNEGLQLEGCYGGIPFPFPKTGAEVMWNRLFKYDVYAFHSDGMTGTVVDSNGGATVTGVGTMWAIYTIYDPAKTTPVGSDEPFQRLRIDYSDPARKAGEKLVVHDSVDMINIGRKAWSYLPGLRRVKLAPDIAYDTPSPTGGGAGTVDEAAVFYGALDRYDFKLIGKKEMLIPYNTFRIRDRNVCPDAVALKTKNFVNPDCMRWELHRVWQVEATLKPGKRHVYPRRVLYWDEDMTGVGLSDNFDASGKVFRVTHSLPISFYEIEGQSTDEWVTMDLATGNYARQENVTDKGGWIPNKAMPASFYGSEALASDGVR